MADHGPGDTTGGFDTDADGQPDTVVFDDGFDLVVRTDLDGDGWTEQILRIGPNGMARLVVDDPEFDPTDPRTGPDPGHTT